MTYPIYIPSKGRAQQTTTIPLLLNEGLEINIVVEEEDYDNYNKEFGENSKVNILVLDKSNEGVYYTRNFCKEQAKDYKFHWQIDDNIKTFRRRVDNKNIKCSFLEIKEEMEEFSKKYSNIGMLSVIQSVWAYTKKTDYTYNVPGSSCMLIATDNDCWFNKGLIDDTDFNIQLLEKELCVVLFNRLLMDKVRSKKMSGGNTEHYESTKNKDRVDNMVKKYPGFFKMKVDKYGVCRTRTLIRWKVKFPQNLIEL